MTRDYPEMLRDYENLSKKQLERFIGYGYDIFSTCDNKVTCLFNEQTDHYMDESERSFSHQLLDLDYQ